MRHVTIVVTCSFPNMARSLELEQQLVKRLRKVVKAWPADPSKKGRDLGEFLKESYVQHFKEECLSNPSKAFDSVESLEKLNSNHYRKLYPREKEYAFSGEVVVKNPWVLSNENLSAMEKRSRSLWGRLTSWRR